MTSTEPLTIELPKCPECGHVSKLPAGTFSGKGFCAGPKGAAHKRTRMVPKTFVEVLEDEGKGGEV